MSKPCAHLENISLEPMPEGGCEECLAMGDTWLHLRYCITCGKTGCCDSSKNTHAHKPADESGHPTVRSKEPGEFWAWCYVDELGIRTDYDG